MDLGILHHNIPSVTFALRRHPNKQPRIWASYLSLTSEPHIWAASASWGSYKVQVIQKDRQRPWGQRRWKTERCVHLLDECRVEPLKFQDVVSKFQIWWEISFLRVRRRAKLRRWIIQQSSLRKTMKWTFNQKKLSHKGGRTSEKTRLGRHYGLVGLRVGTRTQATLAYSVGWQC